jgi:hypothetical protein
MLPETAGVVLNEIVGTDTFSKMSSRTRKSKPRTVLMSVDYYQPAFALGNVKG